MKTFKSALLIVLVISMLVCGGAISAKAAETAETTQKATTFTLSETVFPEADAATGTLKFYIDGHEVYAGAPVSALLAANITTYENFDEVLQPWHMSSVKRVRVELADTKESDKPFVFFVAMNASDEPKKISECMIYSVTINTDDGVRFGSGKESTPFVTGETTKEELLATYGQPDYELVRDGNYGEIAYYEPFSCAYFSFKKGVVRQVTTYYSANVFGELAEASDLKFENSYFGNDCYILMSQYMDVAPYLSGETVETGVLDAVTTKITLGGQELEMGTRVEDMPSPFQEAFVDQLVYIHKEYFTKVGSSKVSEQFYFMNLDGQKKESANRLIVKGVFTENRNYVNWEQDNSGFLEFQYDSITQDAAIEDVLAAYGMPYDIHCTSYARGVFAWLFYKDAAGNELKICVDPILNQLIELRFSKYYEGEIRYQ